MGVKKNSQSRKIDRKFWSRKFRKITDKETAFVVLGASRYSKITQNNHFTTLTIVKCFLDNESITTNILLLKKNFQKKNFQKKISKIRFSFKNVVLSGLLVQNRPKIRPKIGHISFFEKNMKKFSKF